MFSLTIMNQSMLQAPILSSGNGTIASFAAAVPGDSVSPQPKNKKIYTVTCIGLRQDWKGTGGMTTDEAHSIWRP
jgi:hypothetical protein